MTLADLALIRASSEFANFAALVTCGFTRTPLRVIGEQKMTARGDPQSIGLAYPAAALLYCRKPRLTWDRSCGIEEGPRWLQQEAMRAPGEAVLSLKASVAVLVEPILSKLGFQGRAPQVYQILAVHIMGSSHPSQGALP